MHQDPPKSRLDPLLRLRKLSPVFSLHDLRATGMSTGTERSTLTRWTDRNLVAPVGPKCGFYYNLIVDPEGPERNLGRAVTAVYRTAVLAGPVVLYDAGWTTQPPRSLTVIVPQRRSLPAVHGVLAYPRSIEWFTVAAKVIRSAEKGRFSMMSLSPAFALVDAIRHGDSLHGLEPDDIEIPEDDFALNSLAWAVKCLHLPEDLLAPYLEASRVELPEVVDDMPPTPPLRFGSMG